MIFFIEADGVVHHLRLHLHMLLNITIELNSRPEHSLRLKGAHYDK